MPIILHPITPKAFKSQVFIKELTKAMESVEAGIKKDYEAGVKDWSEKPKFTSKTTVNPNGAVSVEVDTDDEIYTYVHEGTGPHPILPKKAKKLRFKGTYTAKTVPGVIQSRQGGASGDDVFSAGVMHPGSKGRFFSKPIKKKWEPFMKRQTQRALDKAAKESGHGV